MTTGTLDRKGVNSHPDGGGSNATGAADKWRRLIISFGPLVALGVLCIVFSIIAPKFATGSNMMAIIQQASIPIVLAMGATLVILVGGIDLSIEGVMAASGLTFALLVANSVNGNNLGFAALIIALLVGVAFGLLNGVIHAKGRIPSFLVTLGTWFIGLGVATVLFGTTTPQISDPTFVSWARQSWLGIPVVVVFAIGAVVLTTVLCKWTRFGIHTYAIGGDEAISRVAGIRVARVKIALFVLAGLFSALGGILATIRLGVGEVGVGDGNLFLTLSAVVVGGTLLSGGRGGPLHSVVGVLLLIVLGNGLLLSGANPYVQQGAQGLIIVLAVIATGWPARKRLRIVK
ncbi:ABC transporter permease [Rhodococcus globerulus]|uniref:ABC transporter permease n=1 Tax=Rhodococcus globerulus TaxID=33008 RepID=A0ABU4C303_RHOGO|nr:ABC transporter permease [Rhodococcus globerulus]MDV6270882.1 ABC transporter permease [Rhodococcus globerulus]